MILSIWNTHNHSTVAHEWERRSLHKWEREELSEIIFVFLGFTFAIGAHFIYEDVVGFSHLWFPWGKLFVSLVSCDYCCAFYSLRKYPRSYWLNDKIPIYACLLTSVWSTFKPSIQNSWMGSAILESSPFCLHNLCQKWCRSWNEKH